MTETNVSTQIVCRVCGESKILESFPKMPTGKHGRTTRCKPCTAVYLKQYQEANKEKLREDHQRRYVENKEIYAGKAKANYQKKKEEIKAKAAKWASENKEKRREISKRYVRKNPQQRYVTQTNNRLANPGMYAAHFKMRQQRVRRALSSWADLKAIEAFYIESARITKETGIKHHVDHYYPLTSDIVCGLHNEFNLRVIPATENLSKANRFPEEIS